MAITVILRSGESVTMKVLPTDNVSMVKKQIEEFKGISLDKQMIRHKGYQLYNEDTLSKKGIKNGSILKMVLINTKGFKFGFNLLYECRTHQTNMFTNSLRGEAHTQLGNKYFEPAINIW